MSVVSLSGPRVCTDIHTNKQSQAKKRFPEAPDLAEVVIMTGYRRLLIGDGNLTRFWQAAQAARPHLKDVPIKSAACLFTLEAGLEMVSDEMDYVIVSVVTSVVIDDGNATDVAGSSRNALESVFKRVTASGRKAPHCQVRSFF